MIRTTTLLALAAGALPAFAAPGEESTTITIYSSAAPGAIPPEWYRPMPMQYGYNPFQGVQIPGCAVVKQERSIDLPARGALTFTDVAAHIDPTTVTFASLTDPDGTRVLEQNYQFDLVNISRLLDRYIDRKIYVNGALVELLSASSSGIVVRTSDGRVDIYQGSSLPQVSFPELPAGFLTRPTLVWDLTADRPGAHDVRVSYQTANITWWADYNLIFTEGTDASSGTLDVGAWVSVLNQSGATYRDARLKLVAGDVHRAPSAPPSMPRARRALEAAAADTLGFEEKAFFEYHLYTLGRPATIPDNSTKQIELFDTARGVPCEKVLVYHGLAGWHPYYSDPAVDRDLGLPMNKKVDIYLRFRNSEEAGMGMPLPKGRIRVSKLDPADGSLEFIGEDVIDHTPRNERVQIKLGEAFDVVGERVQADFKVDSRARWMEETVEVTLRNHKDEAVTVIVRENLFRWVNWEIIKTTADFERIDSRTIHFPVRVEPDGEAVVRYTVRYTW